MNNNNVEVCVENWSIHGNTKQIVRNGTQSGEQDQGSELRINEENLSIVRMVLGFFLSLCPVYVIKDYLD